MKKLFVLIAVVAVGYVLYAVWPTPYTIETIDGSTYRSNRLTGDMEKKVDGGWEKVGEDALPSLRPEDRYSEETGVTNRFEDP